MLLPWSNEIAREVESQDVVTVWLRTGEQPPQIGEAHDRRIGMQAFDQSMLQRPSRREVVGLVEAHRGGAERFRNHVARTLPFEDVWIGEMKRFLQNHLLIGPGDGVVAGSKAYDAALRVTIQDFEEHEPSAVVQEHERIGNELGGYVGYVGGRDDRIRGRGLKFERRIAGVDADGPH